VSGAVVVLIIVVLLVALAVTTLGWERYRPRNRPLHAMPTTEVFIDPVTHRRMRVWMDPASGAREYREELETTATELPTLRPPGLLLPPEVSAEPPRTPPPPPPDAPAG
jgi:hypothetical protein